MMTKIDIKPLSVNKAWQGKRFKTPAYKQFTRDLMLMLPADIKVPGGKLLAIYEFGLSSIHADFDNCIKASQDIMSVKYGFNDNKIYQAIISKTKVAKGKEFIKFKFLPVMDKTEFNKIINLVYNEKL